MTDIATISLRVNTGDLEKGSQALDRFQQTADKAAKSADGVGQSTGKMAASSEQVKKASDYLEKYNGGIDAYTKSLNRRALEENKVGDAVKFQNGELEKLLNRINPLNKSFGELDKIAQKLSQAKELKLIDEVSFARYQAILDSTTDKLYKAEEALTEEGREKIKNARTSELLEESQKKLIQSLNAQAATFKASKADIAEYRASQLGISEQAAPIIASIREQEKAIEREANQKRIAAIQSRSLKQAIKEMELEERTATAQVNRAAKARTDFIQKLKDQVAAQNLSRTELLRYKADQLGAGSAADVYIKKLKESANATHRLGLESAGARQEIAILISEAARGNFGALKGSTITLANRAGWIEQMMTLKGLGIATVVGGITAAAYGLGKAWYEGSQESTEFNKQLILTGNYAGRTAGQLSLLSSSLSSSGRTQSEMAAALAAVVGSGAFSGSSLMMIADTAAKIKASTGQAIDETVKQFQRLQDDPVNAVRELDKSLHFLTAAQLEQITALEEQGRKTDAAKIAMESYAVAMRSRSDSIKENLGSLEQAWKWLGSAASGAWDSMLNIGRDIPVEVKVENVRKQLELAEKNLKSMQAAKPVDTGSYGYGRGSESLISRQSNQKLEDQKALVSRLGKELAELQEQSFQTSIKASRENWDKTEEERKKRQFQADHELKLKYENAEEKHQRELLRIRNGDGSEAAKTTAIERENLRFQQEMSRKRTGPKEPAYRDDSATKMIADSKQRLAALIEQYGVGEKMTEQEKRLVEFNQQIADLKSKKILTADQQSIFNRATEIKSALELEASESRRLENQKKLNALLDSSRKYVTQMSEKGEAFDTASTISNRMASQQATLAQLKIGWLNAGGNLDDDGYKQQEEAAQSYFDKEEALRGNWQAGVKKGFAEYADQATDTYGQVSLITQSAFSGMSMSITDFLVEGKNSFGDFLKTFLKGIAQMMVQLAMLNTMKSALGGTSIGSFLGLANGGLVPAFDTGGYTGDGGKFEPKGVVHGGEFVFTKAATQALGVSNLYALMHGAQGYADGGVVTGKAPMASIPALRPTGGGGMVFNSSITVNGQTSQSSTPVGTAPDGNVLKNQIMGLVDSQISKALGQQGMISNVIDKKIGRR